jgi:hypothetical protein
MPSEWNRTVQSVFKAGKAKNPLYSLKDAMFDAKKVYRSSAKTVSNIANDIKPLIGKSKASRRRRTAKNKKTKK